MVKQFIEKLRIFPKRRIVLAVALVAAFLFSPAEAKINDSQAKEIKDMLEITNFPVFSEYSPEQLKEILNKKIQPKESEITYGILIQSAFSEMEFMDMVLAQSYTGPAREYFKGVLERNVNLGEHWKSTGKKFYDVLKLGESASPARSLAMEIVPITQKTMEILIEIKSLENILVYRGLWAYFDRRSDGDIHKEAWFMAKPLMGGAASNNPYLPTHLTKNSPSQLENQFIALWDRWGPYVGPEGISKKYKEQLAEEMRNTLALALEDQALAEKEEQEESSLLAQLVQQLKQIRERAAELISRVNPFQAGPVVEPEDELAEDVPPLVSELEPEPEPLPSEALAEEGTLEEIQEDLDDVIEELDIVNEEILTEVEPPSIEPEPEVSEVEPPSIEPEPEPEVSEVAPPTTTEGEILGLCQYKGTAPSRFRVLINEVAWAGTADSDDDEWLELKNIWGIPANLAGWQLLDKDGDIKIIFGEDEIIPANDFYLLEDMGGAIDNSDEALYLFDADCNLEDTVEANPNWPGGDKLSKKSMERFDVWSWYTSQNSTPGAANSPAPAALTHPAPLEPPPVSYPKLLINEIYIESKDNVKDDFVELYNPNGKDVDLTDWYLQRKTAGADDFSTYASHALFYGKTIQALDYFLIANASSTFAASADILTTYPLTKNNTLALKNPKGDIVDKVGWGEDAQEYESSPATNPPADKSIGRVGGVDINSNQEDFEVQNLTPGAENQSLSEEEKTEVEPLSVVINEIAWMGTKSSSWDEWIELYNNTTSTIDLTGWQLMEITFPVSTIPAGGFYLAERAEKATNIAADWVYGGERMSNDGENLKLKDAQGNLIDSVNASGTGWFAGAAATSGPSYISMERINSASSSDAENWAGNNLITRNGEDAENNKINGTPKAENSVSLSSTTLASLPFDEFSEVTLTYLGSPYIVTVTNLTVPQEKTLKIEPGVEIKFKEMCYGGYGSCDEDNLRVEGTFLAEGEPDKEILFTSFLPPEGSENWWSRIYFASSSQDSKLNFVRIKYGGQKVSDSFIIIVDKSSISLQNSVIENFNVDGIKLLNSTSTIENLTIQETTAGRAMVISGGKPEIKNSTIRNTYVGVVINNGSQAEILNNYFEGVGIPQVFQGVISVADSSPILENNTGQDNFSNGIYLGGNVNQDWRLARNPNLPYFVESLTTAAGTFLQIEPGVEIRLMGNGSKIIVNGKLEAVGGPDNQVVFTSSELSSWDRIEFNSTEATSTLKYVEISWGGTPIGGDDPKGMLYVTGTVDFQYLTLEKISHYGIYFDNSPQSRVSDSQLKDSSEGGIKITGQCPQITNLTFANVTYPYSRNGNLTTSTDSSLICQ